MKKPPLTQTAEEALENIGRFERELTKNPALQERLSHVHVWYAARHPNGSWAFGPSKFVGYRNNSAAQYLRTYRSSADGGKSEAALGRWFETVDADSRLGSDLMDALVRFLARWNRSPRKFLRIKVLKSELDKMPAAPRERAGAKDRLLARISTDPRICGGRPCIKGTRMRVSDIVDMLAHGAARTEILEDFPYLAEEDIAAALAYAARASDHRVIRAA
jgi:uncharacterized protein (DUF433 family)